VAAYRPAETMEASACMWFNAYRKEQHCRHQYNMCNPVLICGHQKHFKSRLRHLPAGCMRVTGKAPPGLVNAARSDASSTRSNRRGCPTSRPCSPCAVLVAKDWVLTIG
jgi:hypothetical protein